MTVNQALITVLAGTVGTCGFSLLFRINKKHVAFATIGGFITCVVYVICCRYIEDVFFQNFIPALVATAYSEIMARVTKSPATPYIICSVIALVPGGKLYYTMYYFVSGSYADFRVTVLETLKIAAGIAVGIIIISVIIHQINYNKFKQIYDID
ncbi:MAG: threonine/serine exporter family protein [Acutalibacteraceae bacterium]